MSTVTISAQHYMELLDIKAKVEFLHQVTNGRTAGAMRPAHPDTVRLNHLIEWHHAQAEFAHADGAEGPGGLVDTLEFIFGRDPQQDVGDAVRQAIDDDIAATASRAMVDRSTVMVPA